MAAPEEILQLIQRFDDNVEAYCSSGYNEMQVRRSAGILIAPDEIAAIEFRKVEEMSYQ